MQLLRRPFIAILLAALGVSAALAGSDQAVVQPEVGERIDRLLTSMTRLGVFSGAALVVQDGEVLLGKGYGTTAIDSTTPITPQTAFSLASVSKSFTAAAILVLEADGRLRTSDTLGDLLPGVPADKRAITIDQLAHHTSGLPADVRPTTDFYRAVDRETMERGVLALPLESAPGAEFRYSNPGYLLLGAIVERAAGRPFQEFVRRRLLDPAGLRSTGFTGERGRWPERRVAHGAWGLYDVGSPRDWPASWWTLGAGAMVSTLADLRLWLDALQGDRLLPAAARAKLFTPLLGDYAYGWNVRKRDDGSIGVIFHAGATDGAGIEVRRYPARKLFIALACNLQIHDVRLSEDSIYYAFELIRGGEAPPELPAVLDSIRPDPGPTGAYDLPGGGGFTVWSDRAGRLWAAPEGREAFAALHGWVTDFASRYDGALAAARRTADTLGAAPCASASWSPPPIPQRLPEDWPAQWCRDTSTLGAVSKIEWLGAAPLSWSKDRTLVFARVLRARGTRTISWLWEGDQPVEAWSDAAVSYPQSVRLAPLGNHRYVVFDWFKAHQLAVRFEPDGSLVVEAQGGEVRATRRGPRRGPADRAAGIGEPLPPHAPADAR